MISGAKQFVTVTKLISHGVWSPVGKDGPYYKMYVYSMYCPAVNIQFQWLIVL